MFSNYLKIAFRNFRKQKFYSTINVLGLAFGIACCLLIFLYLRHELSFDLYHNKVEDIYRLNTTYVRSDGAPVPQARSAAMWGPYLESEYPEVMAFTRFYRYRSAILVSNEVEDKHFYEGNFFWADSGVFRVFTFPLVRGDSAKALTAPNTVVISESMAAKYFGAKNPIGKTLVYVNRETRFELEVTGVMRAVPANSHFRPDFLGSLSKLLRKVLFFEKITCRFRPFFQTDARCWDFIRFVCI